MTFGTLDQIREMLENRDPNTGEVDTRDDFDVLRIESEVHRAMLARILQCNPDGPPEPYNVLDEVVAAASMDFSRVMSEGNHRLVVVVQDSVSFSGTPEIEITAYVGEGRVTDTISIEDTGSFMSRFLFDNVDLVAGRVVCNADLVASGALISVFENVPGQLTDIENRWTAGLFLMERAKLLRKESEPPVMHPWITQASNDFEAWLKRYCIQEEPGSWQGDDNLLFRRGTSGDIYGDVN